MSTAAPVQHAKTDAITSEQHSSQLKNQFAPQSQQTAISETQNSFTDLRPQANTQRQIQDAANHSLQSRQFQAFQRMTLNSSRSTQMKTISAMMNAPALQRVEDEEALQAKMEDPTVQREEMASTAPKLNNTGLPENLKSGIESLSGMSMDHVKVHYNSSQPAQLNARAYAQGSEIHLAPGQEQHLPHEAWHVVQQAQGRVKPTMQMKTGVSINDDKGLEAEADLMGAKAFGLGAVQMQMYMLGNAGKLEPPPLHANSTVQRLVGFEFETGWKLARGLENLPELNRDEVVASQGGLWKLTAEEVPGQQDTVAEFKTRAIDETDPSAIANVFDSFEAFTKTLASQTDKLTVSSLTNMEVGYEDVTITPVGDLIAQPQVTGGIRLDRILHFMQRTDPAERLRAPLAVQKLGKAGLDTKGDATYQGLVALLAQYVISAADAEKKVEYPKGAISILSRMNLGQLVEKVLETDPNQFVADVMALVAKLRPDPMINLAKDVEAIEQTLSPKTLEVEWKSSVDVVFAKYDKRIDSETLRDLKKKAYQDWQQRYTEYSQRKKNIEKRFVNLPQMMFSEAARANNKIPLLTVHTWLNELATKNIDLITWGFGAPTKTQENREFGIENVGEEARPGVPLELRSLEKVHHSQWRSLAVALVKTIAEINATKEPPPPDRRARTRTNAHLAKTIEAPGRLGIQSAEAEPKGNGKKLVRRSSASELI